MLHRNLKIRIRRGLLLELAWRMLSHIPCRYIYIFTNYIYIHIHRFSLFKASMHERVLAEMEILLNITHLGNCRQGIKVFLFLRASFPLHPPSSWTRPNSVAAIRSQMARGAFRKSRSKAVHPQQHRKP